LGTIASAFMAASAHLRKGRYREAVIVLVVYLSYFGQSFTANLLHERYTGVILGILAGASLIYRGRVRAEKAYRRGVVAYFPPPRVRSVPGGYENWAGRGFG